ncbi:MAG TPA: DUF4276 family protein [Thermoanaerobaculia bacterium]|nr:DUF4276 family protein [Thermoanaerobaculia bacterium]
MKIVVYVEGAGDSAILETLLRPLISKKANAGVAIMFVPATSGDHKKKLLLDTPLRAANALRKNSALTIAVMPDLYPRNKAFRHETCDEMRSGILDRFKKAVTSKDGDERIVARFHVFCLIHDVEVLLLAAEEQLLADRGLDRRVWKTPVEEQNHDDPPKRVVERLFTARKARYKSTVDGPRIVESADYRLIAELCPNGFGKLVAFLKNAAG